LFQTKVLFGSLWETPAKFGAAGCTASYFLFYSFELFGRTFGHLAIVGRFFASALPRWYDRKDIPLLLEGKK
jgi:hypothetical protein